MVPGGRAGPFQKACRRSCPEEREEMGSQPNEVVCPLPLLQGGSLGLKGHCLSKQAIGRVEFISNVWVKKNP